MAQDLKTLITQAQKSVKSSKGPGHITALRALCKRIHTEMGEEKLVELGPAAFLAVFKAIHPDLAKHVKRSQHANVLREYKISLGYKYNHDTGEWVKA